MKIGIVGPNGRMGRAILEEILQNKNCQLSSGVVRKDSDLVGVDIGSLVGVDNLAINMIDDMEELFNLSDAVIDFSSPKTSLEAAKIAEEKQKIHIIGTTGFTNEEIAQLKQIANNAIIIWSANMSIGVNILFGLTEKVAAILDDSYDIDILEMHHRNKVDSPSGTALALGNKAAKGRNVNLDDVAAKTRDGIIGQRLRGEIGFATLRGGDVIGDHTVIFAGDGERIELSHKASNRKIYAKGAIRAALWAKNKQPGLYSMKDVLDI